MRNLRTDRREDRQAQATDRAADRAKRDARQQLAVLDYRLGDGLGAKKERARLQEQLAPAKDKLVAAAAVKKGKK